ALLRSLEPDARFPAYVERVGVLFDLAQSRVRELLDAVSRVMQSPWEEGRVPGVRLLHFDGGPRLATADCGLVYIEADVSYPGHRHRGDEWSLVLQGEAEEDGGRLWAAGDLVHRPAGSSHSFHTLGQVPFVFAVAVHDGIEYESD
ncbi:MAG: cupin domain-containing protein, partial [Myxococcota bacterium]